MADDSILTNSKISQVYIQANYENDKVIQKVIRLVKKKHYSYFASSTSLEGKISLIQRQRKGFTIYGQPSSYPEGYARKFIKSDSLWTRREGHYAARGLGHLVAENPQGNCRESPNLFRMPKNR